MQMILQCLFVFIICVLCSAVCVTGKFAFAQLRREYIEELVEDGDKNAVPLLQMYDNPAVFLGTVQMGMAVFGLIGGATLYYALYGAYDDVLYYAGAPWIVGIVYACVCIVLCGVCWIFGELIPKSIGLQCAEKSLKIIRPVVQPWCKVLYPLICFGNWLGEVMLRRQNLQVTNEIDMAHSEDEIRMLVTASHKEGKIDQVESELIGNVFDFADRLAREIMIPRQNIVCLYIENTMSQHLATIRQSSHTRYPLCDEDKDHVLGLIHIKDLMDLYIHKQSNLRQIKRPILMVPEIMPVSKLLQLMRTRRTYLAMVIDEYGSTVGLIGLEDILEELVGNIKNEHTLEKEEIQPLTGGMYEFAGTVLLEDVEELLHLPVEEDVDTDTIGGYIFTLLGHTPSVKEEVVIGNYRFIVLEMQRFRVARVKAMPLKPEELAQRQETAKEDDQ